MPGVCGSQIRQSLGHLAKRNWRALQGLHLQQHGQPGRGVAEGLKYVLYMYYQQVASYTGSLTLGHLSTSITQCPLSSL